MRVGIVTTSYPRFAGDAAGSFVAAHAAYLRATGAEVEVIAAGDDGAVPSDGVIRVPAAAGLFYGGGAPEAIEAGASPVALVRFAAALTAAVRRRAPTWDAVAAHWWVPSAIAAAIATRRRPLLAVGHGGDIYTARRAHLLTPVAATLMIRGARVVFVSAALRDAALAALPAGLAARVAAAAIVQPMGIDLAGFHRLRALRSARAPDAPRTLAVLARLVPIKGVAIAIDAMRFVRARVRLIIAGDGPLRADLEARARAARAAGHVVVLVGALDHVRRDDLLRDADALVVPSIALPGGRSEGMPMAVLEAMAAGVPVAAAASGGLADLPADAAYLAAPGDPRALALAIDRALTAPPAGADRFIDRLDWARVGASLDEHWRRFDSAPAR